MPLKEQRQDLLIYPIAFLYRQYIELRLKEIIREGRILLGEGTTFPTNHEIENLWGIAKAIAIKAFNEKSRSTSYKFADHVIKEFSAIDPYSYSFRYPATKAGDPYLEGIKHINIRRMAKNIDALSKDLEGISLEISLYLDWQQEMFD